MELETGRKPRRSCLNGGPYRAVTIKHKRAGWNDALLFSLLNQLANT